ncbi:kinase-like domain-containing protein, partial [Zopfochytrium polystomum]
SIVGEGSFGMVRKGLYLESIPVAVKTLKLSRLSEKSKLELINEANILQKSRHPFIIGFHGVVNINDNLSLVLEFASLGSLHDYYLNPDNEDTPLKQRLTFLIQVSAGMSYLHDTLKIMHNDLKSLNVLLTKIFPDGSIVSKITDFGLSKIKTETMTRSTSSAAAGSILWLAPELKRVSPKVFFFTVCCCKGLPSKQSLDFFSKYAGLLCKRCVLICGTYDRGAKLDRRIRHSLGGHGDQPARLH